MKEIILTQKQVAVIDDNDYKIVKDYKWYAIISKTKRTYYAASTINKKMVQMHRLILKASTGQLVDHIDGNGLNNLRENIRICNKTENNRNRHSTVGVSKYKGVTWHKPTKKWRARITVNSKKIHLGLFLLETSAAEAYDKKLKNYLKNLLNPT